MSKVSLVKAVLSQKEVARYLGISRYRVMALERAGYLHRLEDPSGGVCYLRSSLDGFRDMGATGPATSPRRV